MQIVQLLMLNFTIAMVLFLSLWLVNVRIKDPSFIDSLWALGMVLIAWSSFLFVGGRGLTPSCSPRSAPSGACGWASTSSGAGAGTGRTGGMSP